MSDVRTMGCVGKLRYEVVGGTLTKSDLRRIVFHLLTVCDDFEPGDFDSAVAVADVDRVSALAGHDCMQARLEAHGDGQEEGVSPQRGRAVSRDLEQENAALRLELQLAREALRELAAEVMRPSAGYGPACAHGVLLRYCPPCRGDAT